MSNIKHRVLFIIIYGAGLRVSEALNLKVSDIDRERKTLHIRNCKNKKDRYVPLSPIMLDSLYEYWKCCRFTDYVFPGKAPEKPLSTKSISKAFQAAKESAGIKKEGGTHSLRHAFATHLLESGLDLFAIKTLLGHKSIHSTVRYLEFIPNRHKNFKSPVDCLGL